MGTKIFWGACLLLAASAVGVVMGEGGYAAPRETDTTQIAHALRARGPAGLEQALKKYDRLVEYRQTANFADDERARVDADIGLWQEIAEQVGQQRLCTTSRLFWYTNLDEALAESRQSGKPVLSLRMLGKLTDEYSCANSRFFRTTLYSDEQIAQTLRDRYVLHWQSVRPVPVVTIDFGDGRQLKRTITGNSAHYVLADDGTPLDLLPGLYGPKPFAKWLERAAALADNYRRTNPATRALVLREYHTDSQRAIDQRIASDIQQLPEQLRAQGATTLVSWEPIPQVVPRPTATKAAPVAAAKASVEAPVLRNITPTVQVFDLQQQASNQPLWLAIAHLHRDQATLGTTARAIVARENPPTAEQAIGAAISKSLVEDPVVRMVRNLEQSIALDTVRNEYLLHRQVHQWFVDGSANVDVDQLNERVYAQLFLSPSSDPWLGLAPADTYTALPQGGLTTGSRTTAAAR